MLRICNVEKLNNCQENELFTIRYTEPSVNILHFKFKAGGSWFFSRAQTKSGKALTDVIDNTRHVHTNTYGRMLVHKTGLNSTFPMNTRLNPRSGCYDEFRCGGSEKRDTQLWTFVVQLTTRK